MSVSYLFPPDGDDLEVAQLPEPEKPKRNTKAIGDRSELEVAVALARAGYTVSKPLGDSHRYDLIIDDGETLARVQVKTGRLIAGSVVFHCYSTHTHRGGVAIRSYRGEVEYWGCFAGKQATRTSCQNRSSSIRPCTCGLPRPLIDKIDIYGGRAGIG
jgi:hypothetical protein